MTPPLLSLLLIMQPFQANFNQIQAPRVNPQIQAEQIDLGIDKVAAEFQRQESGLKSNMQQMQNNQTAMQNSIRTQMKRSEMDWKGLEKLTDFSKTLEKMLLTRHDDYKKRVEAEQINQAFLDGGDPHKNEQFKEEEAQLEAAHEATVAVSTEYQNKGGLPDIAAEIEKRSGWEKYYYVKGLVMNGAVGWNSYYNQNLETPIIFRDGNPENTAPENIISIKSANNSPEYNSAVRALRDQYVAPYMGLNQELLNEYLISPMRKDMVTQYAQWERDFQDSRTKELGIQRVDSLQSAIRSPNPGELERTINAQLRTNYLRNSSSWTLANKQLTDDLKLLAPNLSPTEFGRLAAIPIQGHSGGKKKTLGDLPGFAEALRESEAAASKKENQIEQQRRRQRAKAKNEIEIKLETEGYFTEEAAKKARTRLLEMGMDANDVENLIVTRDEYRAAEAEELVSSALVRGDSIIPPSLIMELDNPVLADRARRQNQINSATYGMTKDQGDALDKQIDSAARDAADLGGAYPAEASRVAAAKAKEWARRWIANNKDNLPPEKIFEGVSQRITRMFQGLDPETGQPNNKYKDANGNPRIGWDGSQFNPENMPFISLDAEFKRNVETAKATVATLAGNNIKNPYAAGPIKGTEAELEMIKKQVEETGALPPRSTTPIFNILADQAKNIATWEQIVKAQLLKVHGLDFEATYGLSEFDLMDGKDGIDPNEYREIKNLVSVQPTNNTRFRAAVNLNAMQNASEQGALSDPSNPNSPRIGSFVGGDGDLVAQGQGGEYTLNITAVPNGYGPTVQAAADKYGIPSDILAALIDQESSWRADAYNPTGATGIAQIIPKWHPNANPGVDPHADIMYAASYLRQMMTDYGFDLKTAIYAYNAGPNAVLQYGVGASPENKNYYPEIMEKAKKYRRRSYNGGLRSNYVSNVVDSPYNSPDLVSPNIRGRIYQLT